MSDITVPAVKSGFAALIGRSLTKDVTFMNEKVTIRKLNVRQVKEVQELAKSLENADEAGFDILRQIITMAVEGAEGISDTDFETFPMDELSKLSNEIMKFSGIGPDQGK
jgi:hypothetical protein